MTDRSVTHSTFVIERTYDAAPARVFAAFADPEIKARWFGGPEDWDEGEVSVDFRVGGREVNRGGPPGGPVHSFDCLYLDIVPDHRIVYSYTMDMDDKRISASVATIELVPAGAGTRFVLTEQGAYLDGSDNGDQREEGTMGLLDALGVELARQHATT